MNGLLQESNKERYGVDHPMKSELIQLKVKETMLDKYDKEYYFQTDDFKQKAKETTLDRYGAEHYSKSEDWKSIVRSDKYKELRLLQRIDFYNLRGFKFIRQSDNQSKVILVSDECGHVICVPDSYVDVSTYNLHAILRWSVHLIENTNLTTKFCINIL